MTTKEIAKATGKDITTIQRWIKKIDGKMQSVDGKMQSSTSSHPADFTLDEVLGIIEAGAGKEAAGIFRANSGKAPTVSSDRLDRLESLMEKMLLAVGNMMLASQTTPAERKTLPAPQLDPRSHIIKLANEYVSKTGIEHRDAYTMLYREFGYRTHCNAILSAKNRGMKIIDYIDSEGQIETLEAIALEAFAS